LPLTPEEPAAGVCRRKLPLLVAMDLPEVMETYPPAACAAVVPAVIVTAPPAPLVPLPTFTRILPARPDEAVPVPTTIVPLQQKRR